MMFLFSPVSVRPNLPPLHARDLHWMRLFIWPTLLGLTQPGSHLWRELKAPPEDTAHPHAQGPARGALGALRSRTHLFATVFPGPTPRSTVGDALCPLLHPPHLSHPQWEAVPVWGAALAPHQGGLPSLGAACILTPGDGENPSFAKPDIPFPLHPTMLPVPNS